MSLEKQMVASAARNKAEIKQKIHNDIAARPIWELLIKLAQQDSNDASLMARLSC